MSRKGKRVCLVTVVVVLLLLGALFYTETARGNVKTPKGVFVCL